VQWVVAQVSVDGSPTEEFPYRAGVRLMTGTNDPNDPNGPNDPNRNDDDDDDSDDDGDVRDLFSYGSTSTPPSMLFVLAGFLALRTRRVRSFS